MNAPVPLEVLPPGSRLAHYELRSVLGSGGMGTVYLAHDTALDRPVAVKVLRGEAADDPDVVERFVREARAAARVNHPNLAHVYFVSSGDGRPFFAMEYVPGDTFEQRVKSAGALGLEEGIDVLLQAAQGLAAAHSVGVIHRDVKPANLMLSPDGTVKVTDFGLAKSMDADVEQTEGGRLMGTPTYISPEQCRGRRVDARTDIYLLGLTGWFLFAGRPPYESRVLMEVLDHQMNRPLPSLGEVRDDLPASLDALLRQMCAKDPDARPRDMEEVRRRLEALRPRPVHPAPMATRVLAATTDLVLAGFLVAGAAGLAALARGVDRGDDFGPVLPWGFTAIFMAAFWLPEAYLGGTAGQHLFGIRVARADGTAPRRWATGVRMLVAFPVLLAMPLPDEVPWAGIASLVLQGLSMIASMILYFVRDRRSLADLWTGTRVVYRYVAAG